MGHKPKRKTLGTDWLSLPDRPPIPKFPEPSALPIKKRKAKELKYDPSELLHTSAILFLYWAWPKSFFRVYCPYAVNSQGRLKTSFEYLKDTCPHHAFKDAPKQYERQPKFDQLRLLAKPDSRLLDEMPAFPCCIPEINPELNVDKSIKGEETIERPRKRSRRSNGEDLGTRQSGDHVFQQCASIAKGVKLSSTGGGRPTGDDASETLEQRPHESLDFVETSKEPEKTPPQSQNLSIPVDESNSLSPAQTTTSCRSSQRSPTTPQHQLTPNKSSLRQPEYHSLQFRNGQSDRAGNYWRPQKTPRTSMTGRWNHNQRDNKNDKLHTFGSYSSTRHDKSFKGLGRQHPSSTYKARFPKPGQVAERSRSNSSAPSSQGHHDAHDCLRKSSSWLIKTNDLGEVKARYQRGQFHHVNPSKDKEASNHVKGRAGFRNSRYCNKLVYDEYGHY